MSIEQELKLVVMQDSEIDLVELAYLKSMMNGAVVISHLVSTYYDTPDKHLQKMRVGLRMRQYDGQWMQTVKTSGQVKNGLHQRDEWEHDLPSREWDLEQLKTTPLVDLIEQADIWATLSPLFTTDFNRQTLQLTYDDGSEIELAYDRGFVFAGDLKEVIHEVELELKSGSVDALTSLAERLVTDLPLQPSDASKAKQGYELAVKANG